MCGMTQVDTIWGPPSLSPRFIECHHDFTLNEMMSSNVSIQLYVSMGFMFLTYSLLDTLTSFDTNL